MYTEIKPGGAPSMLLNKDWTQRRCFVRAGTQEFCDKLHALPVRADDVWVVTLPKCGTTWMQELVWLVLNNYDFERAKQTPLENRSPFIEFPLFLGKSNLALDCDSPRLIKTHQPLPLLPRELWIKKPKLIYVFRNPKDSFTSCYHFVRSLGHMPGQTLEQFVDATLERELRTQAHWLHVLEFYQLRQEPWIHFTSFERMQRNLRREIEDVCQFLGKAINEEQMTSMLRHLSFEDMKYNPQCQHGIEVNALRKRNNLPPLERTNFIRQGAVGGHKSEMSPDRIAKLDRWIEQSLAPHQLTVNDLLLLN